MNGEPVLTVVSPPTSFDAKSIPIDDKTLYLLIDFLVEKFPEFSGIQVEFKEGELIGVNIYHEQNQIIDTNAVSNALPEFMMTIKETA